MTPFDIVFAEVIGLEGKYSNKPKDRGGPTKYGITEVVARANGYSGDMRKLPLSEAKRIAKIQYWDILRLDNVATIDDEVAFEMFDTGYNMGVGVVGRFLQRSLNALNRQQRDYPDLELDGVVGPVTIDRLRRYVLFRKVEGVIVLLRALNSLQGSRYIEISEKRPENEEFVFGWFFNRVKI